MKIQLLKKTLQIPLFISLAMVLFSSCTKEYSIESGNNPIAAGNWQFSEGGSDFAGNMDTTYIVDGGNIKQLHLVGTSNDGTQSFHLVLYANDFQIGTYKASAYQSSFEYGSAVPMLYAAGQLNGEFIVNITSVNQSLITGTFSGKALKNGQDTVDIVTGIFKAILAPTSSGVLGDSSGNCKPVTIAGNYKQGFTMNSANTVTVQVTVAVPGTYLIYTDIVNGVSFSASGSFAQTGTQTVKLKGSGSPVDAGEKQFAVHFGNSQCAFKVTFDPGAAPSGDYYPLSTQTNWIYDDGTDQIYAKVNGNTFSWNSNTYNVIGLYVNSNDANAADTFNLIRKGGGNYYSYNDYTEIFQSSTPVIFETTFLKDNVAQGASWNSPDFPVTISGVTNQFHFKYTITAKGVPATVGTFDLPDVIKVTEQLYSGSTYMNIQEEKWYAKNIGLVYFSGDITGTWSVNNYQIF